MFSEVETQLAYDLLSLPQRYHLRWSEEADRDLRRILFRSLSRHNHTYFNFFFPHSFVADESSTWSLKEAQGAVDGAEYLPTARGTACGHIFRTGESTYTCKTCAADDTCVLCTKCFESSDHEGHQVFISISPGNTGCCDCGDHEAWKKEVICSIHTDPSTLRPSQYGKAKQQATEAMDTSASSLPHELVEAIRITISRSFDFVCDVFSCSPEQMRLPKTEASVRKDEERSRLSSTMYGADETADNPEFCLVLWNDEKHTIDDVTDQVARACSQSRHTGRQRAVEVDDVGRSVIYYSSDIKKLISMAAVIEQLKLTVTIRSARDTFREQMCATIVDWLSDISGCAVGGDMEPSILRNIVCEEMLKPWRTGSQAGNKNIALRGIDDHEEEDNNQDRLQARIRLFRRAVQPITELAALTAVVEAAPDDDGDEDDDDDDEDDDFDENDDNIDETDELDEDDMGFDAESMEIDTADLPAATNMNTLPMDIELVEDEIDVTEVMEARHAGYPAPPPPPRPRRQLPQSPNDSDDADIDTTTNQSAPFGQVPRTPRSKHVARKTYKAGKHWTETPEAYNGPKPSVPCEDLWQRIRLDWMILYDLRLWKTLRISLRHLYISTVVVIPQFKRILGLRFAGLYTPLAELYLIADREPDHSIINLSIQMLTTPTITEEVIERGNFLTNLMAILYTFLTTRQVGYPDEVNPKAVLAFDAGTVTNRRMFHFFLDLRYLFQSEYVQRRMRMEPRYLLQFLELVRLHQGICPNVRAVGEHVEYESDAWISASLIIKEIDRLCRQIALSFTWEHGDSQSLRRAIRSVAQVALGTTLGFERRRFSYAEIKNPLTFHVIGPFADTMYKVPKHVVQKEHISFHHPLHYLLSWLIEHGLDMSTDELRALLSFSPTEFTDPLRDVRIAPALPSNMNSGLFMSAIFDPPLRVCAWLAQTKAGMWVRNGITLRHQANSYRSVTNRDIGYQRDLFMVQTGLTLLSGDDPSFLAQMIDRFQMSPWMQGDYAIVEGFEEGQQLDVLEDFYHLLVIALSERSHLTNGPTDALLEHDIAHALCFKPLSYSDITSRVTEKVHEADNFASVLERMALYKPPEGISDTGVFELKPEYIELIDPYFAHFTRNAREEAENVYRKYKARQTGQRPEEVVYEPKLQPIHSGVFRDLTAFTRTSLFVQVIFAGLQFSYQAKDVAPNVPLTRVETFLHMLLHLLMIAVTEDRDTGDAGESFIALAVKKTHVLSHAHTVETLLEALVQSEACASCHPAIKRILQLMHLKQPGSFDSTLIEMAAFSRSRTDSPASVSADEKEKKRQAALARQARVMAQMREQQNSFLKNQGLASAEQADDLDDFDDKMSITQEISETKHWDFPTGTCILCQEGTDDGRMFGTFSYIDKSDILRSTPVTDPDYIAEVLNTPENLDEPYLDRPFGVASDNKMPVLRVASDGTPSMTYKQQLSKGFPKNRWSTSGPVSTSCGHMMHYKCFEVYYNATIRRHQQQIARNHPEDTGLNEFICPLCKALGNTFLPIVWKSKECQDASGLSAVSDMCSWLEGISEDPTWQPFADQPVGTAAATQFYRQETINLRLRDHVHKTFLTQLLLQIVEPSVADDDAILPKPAKQPLRRPTSISSLFRFNRPSASRSNDNGPTADSKQELSLAYKRLHRTFASNKLINSDKSNPTTEVVTVLSQALGTSISACEIANRGSTGSLPDSIPEQTITHLRILSETAESALAISGLIGEDETVSELIKTQDGLRQLLFGDRQLDVHMLGQQEAQSRVMLATDSFLVASNWLVAYRPSLHEAVHILRLCLWAEMVKTVLIFASSALPAGTRAEEVGDNFIHSINALLRVRAESAASLLDSSQAPLELEHAKYSSLSTAIQRYALAFLRKSLILLHIRSGIDVAPKTEQGTNEDELTRLCRFLGVEHPLSLLDIYIGSGAASDTLRRLTFGWTAHAVTVCAKEGERPLIQLPHPAIFELIGLPTNYDALTEEAIRRRCPTTGKEVTDPAICLFCGEIFCSQAVCCMVKDERGGCWQHMQKCGPGNMGMFINIRKCHVLLMHGSNGSYLNAPYLDKHGEPDPTLRRRHQLFLSQKRYDKLLRDTWLGHGVQNVISRKLEADINPGGWETL